MQTRFSRLAWAALIGLSISFVAAAAVAEDKPLPALPPPIDLSGDWQLLPGHRAEDITTQPDSFFATGAAWEKTRVPGIWADGRLDCAWELKRFDIPAEAKGLDCEILFERVEWNAQVWLNGKKLGGWPDGYSPFRVLASDAIKPGGENVLLVRVGGFVEVPKSKSGKTLFPAGFSMTGRGGGGGIMGRVFVRFFNNVRITRAQVMPDLATSTAKVWVRVEGTAPEAVVDLAVTEAGIGSDPAKEGREPVVGKASATVKLTAGVGEAVVPVEIKDLHVKLWEPAKPFLYRLHVVATVDGKPADQTAERFGMREIVSKPDGIYLNGHKFRLLGTNLIGDMGYWRGAPGLMDRDKIKAGLIGGARMTNAVCVRTHTSPFPKWWLDVCDEEGLLVLLEFPVTVNCADLKFDENEQAEFARNLKNEAAAVIPYLANHPSIAMWVMTNESNNWHEWERGELFNHFKRLDPSRPTIRASYDTPDGYDIHSYAAMWKGSCGDFEFRCQLAAEIARQKKTPPMITEYWGGVSEQVARKWFGPVADSADPKARARLAVQMAEFSAMRAMEQTEAARRNGFACILPFMGYYGVAPGKTGRPVDYAMPSALAPVGVSIDLANQHFVTGQAYSTDVWVMNDTNAKVATKVQFSLYDSDPGFDPAASLPKAVSQATFDVQVDAHATVTHVFAWKAPANEGQYFVLARIEPPGAKPVTSRRAIYAVKREEAPKSLAGKKVLVIEEPDKKGEKKLSAWIGKLGCTLIDPSVPLAIRPPVQPGPPPTQPDIQLVVVAPGSAMGATFKGLTGWIPGFVYRGGHVVVLEQFTWPEKMKDLFGIAIERTDYDFNDDNAPAEERVDTTKPRVSQENASGGSSRVFRWEQPERAIWNGIADEYLWRWNGQHGRVARVSMMAMPGRARVLVKYAEAERDDLKYVPVAAVPHGQGEVLYFMLQLAGRYDSADPDFDPIAERLMVNLLGR